MGSTIEGRLRFALAASLTLAAIALAGCAEDGAPPANSLDRDETIAPGEFFEANLAMNESAGIAYRWSTSPETAVGFDVHSHEGGEIRYHEQASAASREGSFTAPEQGAFSLLWENPADEPVEVAIHVEGEFAIASVAP